ncbi:MAG: nicotinate-nucleotide adenylyltransferase [Syntrophomonadaceae bacterium]|nr:nicotinate-nucleotide adenylyltransferase [Syntrophomonadaceae bacterium]
MKRIGLLGGTFDPIHHGHLVLAECAHYEARLDRVIFVPAARPPHKEAGPVVKGDYRYRMVRIAIEDNPHFAVSEVEMRRPGRSYTIDTVREFRERYPGSELYFIVGMDALLEIKTWKDVDELVRLCGFIAAVRPKYSQDLADPRLAGLPDDFWRRLQLVEVPGLDISSTDLRRRLAAGKPVRYLMPPAVEDYVRRHNFYGGGTHD